MLAGLTPAVRSPTTPPPEPWQVAMESALLAASANEDGSKPLQWSSTAIPGDQWAVSSVDPMAMLQTFDTGLPSR